MAKNNDKKTITGLELKYEVLLVYLVSLIGFIFAFLKEEKVSDDARFHYKQSGATFIVYLVISIISSTITSISVLFAVTPLFVISIILGILSTLLWIVDGIVLVFAIIAIVKAFNDEKYEIPVIINLANAIWKK